MTEDEVVIPKIATLSLPKLGVRGGYQPEAGGEKPAAPTTGSGVEGPEIAETDAVLIARASLMVNQFKQDREKLQIMITETSLALEAANKRAAALQLENVELKNNANVMSAMCEDLRQEASDLRALFSSIRAQFEHFEIPLPIRKRAHKLGEPK